MKNTRLSTELAGERRTRMVLPEEGVDAARWQVLQKVAPSGIESRVEMLYDCARSILASRQAGKQYFLEMRR